MFHLPVRGNGDGGIYTTAADVSSLWSAFFAGRIVSMDWVAEMVRPRSDVPEQSLRYGLGFWLHASSDVVELHGYDAGVSFRSTHDPATATTHTRDLEHVRGNLADREPPRRTAGDLDEPAEAVATRRRRSPTILRRMDPTDPPISVVRAEPDRLPHLAGVLGRALVNDPLFQWPFRGAGSAEMITELVCTLYAQPSEMGMLWEGGDGAGAAVWVPPGDAALLAAPDRADELRSLGLDDGRSRQMWDWLESNVAEGFLVPGHLGVDPTHQRRGVGRALVLHGLGSARAEGAAAFLETSAMENIRYYERLGFNVVDEGDPPNGGPHVWFMRCEL